MAILNEEFEWRHFERNPDIRDAFRGAPVKTLLPASQMLCRFITTETGKPTYPDSGIYSSPWWTDWSTTAEMLHRWKTAGASPVDIIRGLLAVTTGFSAKLDGMVQIILTQPVYAWKGPARHQSEKSSSLSYIGGGEQFFLPNLVKDRRSLNCPVAYMHCYCSVDTLV
jgi:hypothetical protein